LQAEPAPAAPRPEPPAIEPQPPLWDEMRPLEEAAARHGDELLAEAIEYIRRTGKASTSLLQRRFRIGYTRAARLMDVMEEDGVIGPPTGTSKAREVLPAEEEAADDAGRPVAAEFEGAAPAGADAPDEGDDFSGEVWGGR
ncbi:MAG: DNA translocase FtsK, partial [Candidatus Promineifilaceae bacterium]